MNYAEKIKAVRNSLGLNQSEFAEKTTIPLSSLRKLETGHASVGLTAIEKIISQAELECYSLWLMTDKTAPESGQISPDCDQVIIPNTEHIQLPFYEITASAGIGVLVEIEDQAKTISFEPEWLRKEVGVNPNDVFLMLVDGDSMYPTLKNGSMIMVDKNLSGLSDGIYVMRHDNSLLVKRLQSLPNGIVKVKSDNTMYEPWEIKREDFNGTDLELIGRVVWSGQRM